MTREFNTIDIFCGCGGLSLGFQNAGFNVIKAFDNWSLVGLSDHKTPSSFNLAIVSSALL